MDQRVNFEIYFQPGFYKMPLADERWKKLKHSPKVFSLLKPEKLRLRLIADYWSPIDNEIILEGGFAYVLAEIEKRFKSGLKLSQSLIYTVHSLTELYIRLKETAKNRQDTLIRLPSCRSIPCISNPKWLRRLRTIQMPEPDGTILRLQSQYDSINMDKFEFFKSGLKPFLLP